MAQTRGLTSMHDRTTVDALKAALTTAAKEGEPGSAYVKTRELLAAMFKVRGAEALTVCARAAKGSGKRALVLCDLWLDLGASGCSISDTAIMQVLTDPKHSSRHHVLGRIANAGPEGSSQRHERFALQLRGIVRDRDDPEWAHAVSALCRWRDEPSLPLLLEHTRGVETPFVLLAGLIRFKAPEAVIVFEMNLRHPAPRTRRVAMWGLAALGYDCAIGSLVGLLDGPDVHADMLAKGPWTPGDTMRAAQALADVFKLPFEWGDQASINAIKAHCTKLYSPADVARCQADLAAGRFVAQTPKSARST
jgi:hypothetical protein